MKIIGLFESSHPDRTIVDMKEISIISLLPVFILGWVGYHFDGPYDDDKKTQQISLGKFSIGDSCEQCSGGIDLMLITSGRKDSIKSYLNKIIMDALVREAPNAEHYLVDDFEHNRNFGEEDCIGISIVTVLNVNAQSVLSLTAKSEGVCGTSVGDYFPEHHVTIDLIRNEVLSLGKVIRKGRWNDFEQFVVAYAKANKIDNVLYIEGENEEDKHDQRKITYLPGLDSSFYVKEKVLGVYIKIDDKNTRDWSRRSGEEETIGIEYMNVEVPFSEVKRFIDPGTAVFGLIAR